MVIFLSGAKGGVVVAMWAVVLSGPVGCMIGFFVLSICKVHNGDLETILGNLYHVGGGLMG